MRRLILLVLAGLLASAPATAWNGRGHKATASIAFDQMSPDRQREVISILRSHPRFDEDFQSRMPSAVVGSSASDQGRWLLEQASIWPDLIQLLDDEIKQEYNRSRWHYINLMVWLTDSDEDAMSRNLDHNMALTFEPPLRQNLNVVQALRGNLGVWRDDSASDADKAVALCWILHLVGDMHQPLHTVALFSSAYFPKGDRGGNDINVMWGDETKNLHAIWDSLPSDLEDLEPTERTKRSLKEDVADDRAIEEWLHHHANLAKKFVYTDDVKTQLTAGLRNRSLPDIKVSREYLIAARTIARRQVNLAGHRIAALLN